MTYPIAKNLFLISPWNLQRLLFVSVAPYPFVVCLWGKSLFPSSWYPPITQLKTAINSTPSCPLPQSSLLQAKQTHLSASPCTSCAPALSPSWCLSAGLPPVCHCLSCTRHSTPSGVSQVLNWEELITEVMPGAFSLGEKGIFLKSTQIAFSEWIEKTKGLYLKLQ